MRTREGQQMKSTSSHVDVVVNQTRSHMIMFELDLTLFGRLFAAKLIPSGIA